MSRESFLVMKIPIAKICQKDLLSPNSKEVGRDLFCSLLLIFCFGLQQISQCTMRMKKRRKKKKKKRRGLWWLYGEKMVDIVLCCLVMMVSRESCLLLFHVQCRNHCNRAHHIDHITINVVSHISRFDLTTLVTHYTPGHTSSRD